LYDFPLDLLSCLRTAPRQPEYRAGREHREFVTNLPVSIDALRAALRTAWPTTNSLTAWPRELTERLVAERYSRDEWNLRI
jgi:lipoate-protein ligase A